MARVGIILFSLTFLWGVLARTDYWHNVVAYLIAFINISVVFVFVICPIYIAYKSLEAEMNLPTKPGSN